jgi:hypothetical protein
VEKRNIPWFDDVHILNSEVGYQPPKSPILGGFFKKQGDTPRPPSGEKSPVPLLFSGCYTPFIFQALPSSAPPST